VPPKKTPAIRSVDDYIRAQPAAVRPVLGRVRAVLRKALPGADEVLSYRIPAYRLNGRIVIFFAGWKEHYSIYPAGDQSVLVAFQKELASYEIAKGTIRQVSGRAASAGPRVKSASCIADRTFATPGCVPSAGIRTESE
jgi:uncharacterized protein YdhG (YjbR/CyaY superfamily)